MKNDSLLCLAATLCLTLTGCRPSAPTFTSVNDLVLNDSNYFETRGLNYLVFSNIYDATFDDSKISAVELIHHGVRTATNGDVRMNPTPGQWDKLPKYIDRTPNREERRMDVQLGYPEYDFNYRLTGEARDGGFYLSVNVDKPLPEALNGVAGLNLEFIPPVFFGHSYIMDGKHGLFPTSPADFMTVINGQVEPTPMAVGKQIEIAPDEPLKHVTIRTTDGSNLLLFDGRNKQQNGNFVVRTLLPAGKTGKIAEWFITAEVCPQWVRQPVVAYSQVGYHPAQQKMAVVELDRNDKPLSTLSIYKVGNDGKLTRALSGKPHSWGQFTRYNYLQFDFSSVREPGIYVLEYGDHRTAPFPIATDVFQKAWFPTMDVFFPVQMDHMFVREAYRVWHGAPHLDDALQAPLNRIHWDGWKQGPTTGNKYKPLQHIPGLNVGGWFDAGDFDIQTGSQHSVVQSFALLWESFGTNRDETTINQQTRYTEIHLPDGKPDLLQQIEHGVLQLVAQVNAIGYAIPGINESHLYQYRHLGDAVNKTDNIVGTPDDRWAFTNRSPRMNYCTAISLAAASRALKEYNPELSREALRVARYIWDDEHNRTAPQDEDPANSRWSTAEVMRPIECRAAFELWRSTGDVGYKARMNELLPHLLENFNRNAQVIAQMVPYMDSAFKQQVKPLVEAYARSLPDADRESPYGVRISTAGWAGNRNIVQSAITNYLLHRSYPDLIDPEYIYRALHYLYGCHPCHNLSFVSGVGAQPKRVAYGSNRADFSFIPGGVVPGVRILKPDFPENRDDYPFLWSENEYVIDLAASYVYLVNAVNSMLK